MPESFAERLARQSIEIALREIDHAETVHTLAELARFSIESNHAYHFKPRPLIEPAIEDRIRGAVDLVNLEALSDRSAEANRQATSQLAPSFTF